MVEADRLAKLGTAFSTPYADLPAPFYSRVHPTPVANPHLIAFNRGLAGELGLDVGELDDDMLAAVFSGNSILPESNPTALVYAGHQFGGFVPQLGDGRAILLGEVHDRTGRRRDIQLKGAGRTPYSRGGDGRAAVGPVLREYLVSEAMHTLGVPATRALAAVATGETVNREQALPGAVLTRVAASHVRVGTFQYFAARGDTTSTRQLADHVIGRHYADTAAAANPYLELLRAVVRRQAGLVARWMNVGFIHGVMNTDNMSVSGETIDFGPCAFMDTYDPAMVFSSIDRMGRYAYKNQPAAAAWNLARFAETLLMLIDPVVDRAIEMASEVLAGFATEFEAQWLAGMRKKLGLFLDEDGDAALGRELLDAMQTGAADFTLTFRSLGDFLQSGAPDDAALRHVFSRPAGYTEWATAWRSRLAREPQSDAEHAALMRGANPAVIPRNHRIEQAIVAAVEENNFGEFEQLGLALSKPYETIAAFSRYAKPPLPEERVLQTFCGT